MSGNLKGPAGDHIRRLQRYQAFEIQAARLLGGWLPGIARWEVKHQVGLHLWEDAQHSRDLRTRLWELRTPNPDRGVDAKVRPVVQALAQAQHDYELLAGLYLVLKAELLAAYRAYVASTYDVYDAPTIPVLKKIAAEKQAQVDWAQRVVHELADSGERNRQVRRWMRFAHEAVAAAGGVDGTGAETAPPEPPPGYASLLPFPEAHRDERFQTVLHGGIELDESDPMGRVIWQFVNYTQEMQAAETLGSVLWEADGMPWEFYFDIARHCYDEVRHSQIGETRLTELGYHLTDYPHSVGSYAWRQMTDPMRRYCILTYVIESGAFPLKQDSYQLYLQQGDMTSAQAILYDMIDETLHVRLGHKWVPELMKRYGYTGTEDELTLECRQITARNAVSKVQRAVAGVDA